MNENIPTNDGDEIIIVYQKLFSEIEKNIPSLIAKHYESIYNNIKEYLESNSNDDLTDKCLYHENDSS